MEHAIRYEVFPMKAGMPYFNPKIYVYCILNIHNTWICSLHYNIKRKLNKSIF